MRVRCVVDRGLPPTFQLGDSLEMFVRGEDAERFLEDVRADMRTVRDVGGRSANVCPKPSCAFRGGGVRPWSPNVTPPPATTNVWPDD